MTNLLDFVRYCWQRLDEFIVGRHTLAIANAIDDAIIDFRAGKSTFLIVKVPFRHGKSELVSRYLPAYFLSRFPECEVMLTTYGADLSEDFSRFARKVVASEQFQELYEGTIQLDKSSAAVDRWGLQGFNGGMRATGLGGTMTGRGYHLGIMDDYVKNRQEAESPRTRAQRWDSFKDDFMTRRAPVSITLIVATPWHVDDVIGRIIKEMQKSADFPHFRVIAFPARDARYESGYLWPERFSAKWYEEQFATLGKYAAAGLLQVNPTRREGNLFHMAGVRMIQANEVPAGLQWFRVWDLAHTAKERVKDDPDWTAGTLMATRQENGVPRVWIKDVVRVQANAPERDRLIRATAMRDDMAVKVVVECSVDAMDAYHTVKEALKGARIVNRHLPHGDKVVRAAPLEPVFEAGNIAVVEGDWNAEWLDEFSIFPEGPHDDQVDTLSAGFAFARQNRQMTSLFAEVSRAN